MLRHEFMFQHKQFGIGSRNVTYVAGVPTIILTANHARARLNWVTAIDGLLMNGIVLFTYKS